MKKLKFYFWNSPSHTTVEEINFSNNFLFQWLIEEEKATEKKIIRTTRAEKNTFKDATANSRTEEL